MRSFTIQCYLGSGVSRSANLSMEMGPLWDCKGRESSKRMETESFLQKSNHYENSYQERVVLKHHDSKAIHAEQMTSPLSTLTFSIIGCGFTASLSSHLTRCHQTAEPAATHAKCVESCLDCHSWVTLVWFNGVSTLQTPITELR